MLSVLEGMGCYLNVATLEGSPEKDTRIFLP